MMRTRTGPLLCLMGSCEAESTAARLIVVSHRPGTRQVKGNVGRHRCYKRRPATRSNACWNAVRQGEARWHATRTRVRHTKEGAGDGSRGEQARGGVTPVRPGHRSLVGSMPASLLLFGLATLGGPEFGASSGDGPAPMD